MTVADLVAEGDSFRVAHPTATADRLRTYLLDLAAPPVRGSWGGGSAVGSLLTVLLTPPRLLYGWTVGRFLRKQHADRVERAMTILTAKPAPRKKRRRPSQSDTSAD